MSCEQARERLMELEEAAWGTVEHLRDCERCQAFAARLREVDGIVAQRVETFAARGDFEREWATARAIVQTQRRRPIFRTFFAVSALAAALMLTFRLALLPVLPLPNPWRSEPVVPKPVRLPVLETVPVVAPAPAPAPPPAPEPAPRSPASVPPELPVRVPLPQELIHARPSQPLRSPKPEPPPRPAAELPRPKPAPRVVPLDRSVTIEIDPALPLSGSLSCPSARIRGAASGRTLRFEGVPDEPCALQLESSTLSGVLPGGNAYRVELIDGTAVLSPR